MCLKLSRMLFAFSFTFNGYRFGVVANRLPSLGFSSLSPTRLEFKPMAKPKPMVKPRLLCNKRTYFASSNFMLWGSENISLSMGSLWVPGGLAQTRLCHT